METWGLSSLLGTDFESRSQDSTGERQLATCSGPLLEVCTSVGKIVCRELDSVTSNAAVTTQGRIAIEIYYERESENGEFSVTVLHSAFPLQISGLKSAVVCQEKESNITIRELPQRGQIQPLLIKTYSVKLTATKKVVTAAILQMLFARKYARICQIFNVSLCVNSVHEVECHIAMRKYASNLQTEMLARAQIGFEFAIQERECLFEQLIPVLTNVNEKGFRHGNIKLSNVLIDENGDYALTDFGMDCNSDNRPDWYRDQTRSYCSLIANEDKFIFDINSLCCVVALAEQCKSLFQEDTSDKSEIFESIKAIRSAFFAQREMQITPAKPVQRSTQMDMYIIADEDSKQDFDPAKADHLREAIEQYEKAGNTSVLEFIHSCQLYSLYKLSQNDLSAAFEYISKIENTTTDLTLVNTFLIKHDIFSRRNEREKAKECLFQAEKLLDSLTVHESFYIPIWTRTAALQYQSHQDSQACDTLNRINTVIQESPEEYRDLHLASHCNNLAIALQDMGDLTHAEIYFCHAIDIQRKSGADKHQLASFCNSLALLQKSQGRFDDALEAMLECLQLQQETLERNDPALGVTYASIASIYLAKGSLTEAEITAKKSMQISKSAYGEEHPTVAAACHVLGVVHMLRGQMNEAEEFVCKCEEIQRKTFGMVDPEVAETRSWLEERKKTGKLGVSAAKKVRQVSGGGREAGGHSHQKSGTSKSQKKKKKR